MSPPVLAETLNNTANKHPSPQKINAQLIRDSMRGYMETQLQVKANMKKQQKRLLRKLQAGTKAVVSVNKVKRNRHTENDG